jgi:predicted DNA-binding ribbon-helix-helix protein
MMKTRRIDIFGRPTSLYLEPEYVAWIAEIRNKTGLSLRDLVEKIAVKKPRGRSLASAVRVAVAAYFHGRPYPIYRTPGGIVLMRSGAVEAVPAEAGSADQHRAHQRAAFPPLPHRECSHSIAVEAPAIP